MILTDLQIKADEMANGWDELSKHVEARVAFGEFVSSALQEHGAETTNDLPQHLRDSIARRDSGLKSHEWLTAELARLEQLGQDLLPEVFEFVGTPGLVN
jgi:hypothetical protein